MNNLTKYFLIILLTSCATTKPSLQEVQRLCGGGDVEKYHYSNDESSMRINCQRSER